MAISESLVKTNKLKLFLLSLGCDKNLVDAEFMLKELLDYGFAYTEDENEAVAEIKTPMTDYIKESRALFATGAMDPNSDSDWQNYLDSLESLGLSQWQTAAQAAYSRLTK